MPPGSAPSLAASVQIRFGRLPLTKNIVGTDVQRLVRLRTPGPCTYSLQPRPAPHPRSPAAQARRSSPVVSSGSVASVRLFEHSHVCKSTVYKACAKPVLCKPHNIFTDVTRWTVLCIEEGGLLPSPHTTSYSAVFLVPQSVSIDIVKP